REPAHRGTVERVFPQGVAKENEMRASLKALVLAAALALGLAAVPGAARADDAKSVPSPNTVLKALAEAGKPGAEHQKLQPFVGDWDLTLKLWTDPGQPPALVKATVQRQWIMGGRFVQETVRGEFEGKPFEGMGVLGYDSARKKFTTTRVCGL